MNLKLENEVISETEENTSSSEILSDQIATDQESELQVKNIVENSETNDFEQSFTQEALNSLEVTNEPTETEVEKTSNGLENFGIQEEASPDLFSSESNGIEPQIR